MIGLFSDDGLDQDLKLLSGIFSVLSVIMFLMAVLFLCTSNIAPTFTCIYIGSSYLLAQTLIAAKKFNFCTMLMHFNGMVYVLVNCYYFSFDYGFQYYCLHTVAFCYISVFKYRYQALLLAYAGVACYVGAYWISHHGYSLDKRLLIADYDLAHLLYVFHVSSLLMMFWAVILTMRSKLYTNVIDKTLDNLTVKSDGYSDILSGLRPRLNFIETIDSLEDVRSANLAIIDIDRFKQINDFYGFEQGDKIIAAAARLAREVFASAYICRWSGEEFLVFHQNGDSDEFYKQCLEFSSRFAALQFEPGGYSCSCSIGCLCVRDEYRNYSFDEYLNKLEKNLQDAKSIGRASIITSNF